MSLRDYTDFFKKKFLTEDVILTNEEGKELKITLRSLNTKDGMLAESILDRLSLKSSEDVPLSLTRLQSYNTQAVLAVSLFKVNGEPVEGADFVGDLYMQAKLKGRVLFEGRPMTADDIYEEFILPRLEFINNLPVNYLQQLMETYNKMLNDLNNYLEGTETGVSGVKDFFRKSEGDSDSASEETGSASA